jgi:putative ABC transport system permease protein
MIEIFFSFIVLFAVGAKVFSDVSKFIEPLGYSYENVRVLSPGYYASEETKSEAEIRGILSQMMQELLSCPEVEEASWVSGNVPFINARFGQDFEYQDRKVKTDFTVVDDNFASLMNLQILEGRWFSREDDGASARPIVVDRRFRDEFFAGQSPVGQVISGEKYDRKIVGVIDRYHYRGELKEHRLAMFQRYVFEDTTKSLPDKIVFSVREGAGFQFEVALLKRFSILTHGWPVSIKALANLRDHHIKDYLTEIITIGIVAVFLVFNVALGLFGVLWYSINRRRGEIGLRRAIGASRGKISAQVLFEALVMATFAIVVGIFFAAQAPILGLEKTIGAPIWVIAMAYSAVMIYLIVSICALYPSRLAGRVQPAEALHDE